MTPGERLTEVFDRGMKHGEAALTPAERQLLAVAVLATLMYAERMRRHWVICRNHAASYAVENGTHAISC